MIHTTQEGNIRLLQNPRSLPRGDIGPLPQVPHGQNVQHPVLAAEAQSVVRAAVVQLAATARKRDREYRRAVVEHREEQQLAARPGGHPVVRVVRRTCVEVSWSSYVRNNIRIFLPRRYMIT